MDEKKYYEYEENAGNDWMRKKVPYLDPRIQDELNATTGLNPFGEPRLRISWAGTLLHDYTVEPQLKYKITYRRVIGFYYVKKDGTTGYVRSMNLATDAADKTKFAPRYEEIPLGRLRWIVEEWESAESLKAKGRFKNLHDPSGKQILRELPPKGVYNAYFWIQTRDRKYRSVDRQVLEAIKAMWQYDITTSEAQRALDEIEAAKEQRIIAGAEARSIWAGLGQD